MYGQGVTNPAINIRGITYQVNIAPPVINTSTIFIAASIDIIDSKDIPHAVLKASSKANCFYKITVSSAIEVNKPFIIAKIIMDIVAQPELGIINWKNAMVPKSPIEQPIKHHFVL